MKKWVLLFAATAAAVQWALLLPQMETYSARSVTVVQVSAGAYTEQVACAGKLRAASAETVSYGYSLRPAHILVSEGDRVQAGQVLMDVDRDQTLTALALTQGTSGGVSAAALSAQTSSGAVSSDAASRLAQALGDWIPQTTSASQTSSGLDALLQQYAAMAGTGAASQLEEQLSSQAAQASSVSSAASETENVLAAAVLQVPRQVTAPVAGVVTQVGAEEGAFTEAGQSLFTISDTDALELVGEVDAGQIARVQTGQTAAIAVSGIGQYTGSVVKIAPQAHDSTSGTAKSVVDVTVCVQPPYDGLMPNLNASASITVYTGKNAVSVPYEAVREDDSGQEYVWAVENGRVRRRNIKTGSESENTVQVLSGLSAGERLVLSPDDSLQAGDAVLVRGVRHV